MISYLKGELAGAGEGMAVVDVGGMGFRVFITDRDQADLPAVGEPVQLYTYLSVREDAIWLYGFLSEEDRQVFRQLLTVSGVGPKAALGILSALSANDLRFAVFSDDVKAISKAPGVGLKTAKKLILELKDRLKLEDAIPGGGNMGEEAGSHAQDADVTEAVEALVTLGYSSSEALRAVKRVKMAGNMKTEDILGEALKVIGL
ncbi:MAG TPA: Holliday junction branch migration protein RuvA [Lachnospiraceae bacterium]|nr:Holliday junction branch migration protein RuvA [Lachnospiraceae bacterium]